MKWNNSTDKFENDELLETLLKSWKNSLSHYRVVTLFMPRPGGAAETDGIVISLACPLL
jgi:carotenoid cleavage dioxygenase-like enzyme